MPKHAPLLLLLACLALAAACSPEPPPYRTYENAQAGFRFNPSQGWDVKEREEPGCLHAVEASKGPDLRFVICVSAPRTDILLTRNAFVSCENIKQYIESDLKGIKPVCSRGGTTTLSGYDTLYARLLKSGDRVRVQFVNHLFIPASGRLIQVMSMAVADDDKAARELFDANRHSFFAMMGSVRTR